MRFAEVTIKGFDNPNLVSLQKKVDSNILTYLLYKI